LIPTWKLSASYPKRRSRDLAHIGVSKSLFFRHVAVLGSCECSSPQLIGGLKRVNYGPAILGELTLPLKLSEMEKRNRDEPLTYLPAKRYFAPILRVGTDNPLNNAALEKNAVFKGRNMN
jgi:hypothetical protein